jgi:hypothetical protein
MTMPEFDFLLDIDLFKKSLSEQQAVIKHFWEKAGSVLDGSGIRLKPLPKSWTNLRQNQFSVLFIAIFFVLKIPLQRLRLYARLNHCLRSWVTACDNLLDCELKEMILTDLPEKAGTFKSVHTLLVTDRVFFSFLMDAVHSTIISEEEMMRLLSVSLSSISASGREEAEEEGGIDHTLPPGEVLERIHSVKTGQLFTSPLYAPIALGDIKTEDPQVGNAREGLMAFGLGCQILDDLSDLGMDLYDNKYNYLAALIVYGNDMKERDRWLALSSDGSTQSIRDDYRLYQKFPRASKNAIDMAVNQLQRALTCLSRAGLPMDSINRESFIKVLIKVFRHPNRLLNIRER